LILNQTLNLNFLTVTYFFLPYLYLLLGPCSYIFVLFCLYIISYSLNNNFNLTFINVESSFYLFYSYFILISFHFHVSHSILSCFILVLIILIFSISFYSFISMFTFFLFYCVIIFSCNSCSSTDLISFILFYVLIISISFQFFFFIPMFSCFHFIPAFHLYFIAFHSLFLFIF